MRKLAIYVFLVILGGYAFGQDVVATTSVLSSVIEDVAGGRVRTATLVPAGSCPGHFDLKVRHLELVEKSGVLFAQGFEEYLSKIKESIRNPRLTVFTVEAKGNWLVPETQMEVYGRICGILSELFPGNREFFGTNRKRAEKSIGKTDSAVKKMVEERKLAGLPVICNSHIKDMLEYLGFNVVAAYGRKEELTVADIRNLIELAGKHGVRLVVDNLQAGPDTGMAVAGPLNIAHVAISNFPGVLPGTRTLRQTLYEDVKRIINVYGSHYKAF